MENKDLEFLSAKTREMLNRQISTYRTSHAKAGTVIGILSIFMPVFVFIIENAHAYIQVMATLPIAATGYALYLMLQVLRAEPLEDGFNVDQFDALSNSEYEDILLYEIGANTGSYKDNELITGKQNRKFNRGLVITMAAISLSVLLLLANLYINHKQNKMEKKQNNDTSQNKKEVKKKRVIPYVPKGERVKLNEGVKGK